MGKIQFLLEISKYSLTLQPDTLVNTSGQVLFSSPAMAPRVRATQSSRDTRKTIKQSNQLSLPHQDDCNTRMDIT